MKAHGKTVWFPLELESNARRRTGVAFFQRRSIFRVIVEDDVKIGKAEE